LSRQIIEHHIDVNYAGPGNAASIMHLPANGNMVRHQRV
jgi:hypothetical protein